MTKDSDAEQFKKRILQEAKVYENALSLLGGNGARKAIAAAKDPHDIKSDSEMLIVLVTAVGILLTYLSTRKSQKIIIHGRDGTRVEIPQNTKGENLDQYKDFVLNNMDEPKIVDPNISQEDWDQLEREFWHKLRNSS